MVYEAKSGHPGGSLSATDILTVLYSKVLRHDPQRPDWPERDRFVMSKGHCTPVQYALLAELGYIPIEELDTFRRAGTRLQGHSVLGKPPGIENSAGSLGMGLSFGLGIVLAARLRDLDSDASTGKRTLAVRWGRMASRVEYAFLVAVGLCTPVLGVALFGWPFASLAALLAGFFALGPLRLIMTRDGAEDLVPTLPGTARMVGLYGLLLALGLAFG